MKYSLFFRTDAYILCLLLFFACIVVVWLGRLIRKKFLYKDLEESKGVVNLVLGALLGLWGFMLAFTFGHSASRFHDFLSTTVEEHSAIRSVIYRTETFPDSIGNDFRDILKEYVQARVDYYYAHDLHQFNKARNDALRLSRILWRRTQQISQLPNLNAPASAMFSALTSMFDFEARNDALLSSGIPDMIFYFLFFMAIVISFIGGLAMHVIGAKEWVVFAGFILLATMIVFITLDLNRPLRGFIKPEIGENRIENLLNLFSK